jgi:hypothetical protein
VPKSSIIPVYIAPSTYDPRCESAKPKIQKNLIFSPDGEATRVPSLPQTPVSIAHWG